MLQEAGKRWLKALSFGLFIGGSHVLGGTASAQSVEPTVLQKALNSVDAQSLSLTGTVFEAMNGRTGTFMAQPAKLELRLLTPDHYLKIRDEPNGFTEHGGFAGSAPLYRYRTPSTSGAGSIMDWTAYMRFQRPLAARLFIGILGVVNGPLPLRIAPDSTASTLHVTGQDGFDCHVIIAQDTGIPLRVEYQDNAVFFTPPAPGQFQAARRTERAQLTWTFSDRMPVDGVLVPHSITLTARSLSNGQVITVQQIHIDSAEVNKLSKSDFAIK